MFHKYWKSLRNVDLKNGFDLGTKPEENYFRVKTVKSEKEE